jgi:predicted 3-demethylubiquinone-9 3-methyltransferase (glyoxalase superfamily)
MPRTITPNLWFDTQAEEAAEFYCSVFPNSKIVDVARYPDAVPEKAGQVLVVNFELDGQLVTAINGGPEFTLDEAFSFVVDCEDQAEIDYYWDALRAGGGVESQCGWLKDRFGLSWQVVPVQLDDVMSRPDPEGVARAMAAMLTMGKLDIEGLEAAYRGELSVE